jgi:cyclohexanone monooxygenase
MRMTGHKDVLIVGAGFAGMYLLHRLREAGFDVRTLEAAPEVGGTWYHNRYPGLRCDVESLEYQYAWNDALRRDWRWSERYSAQPEILAYAKWVADRLDLRRDIRFNTRVARAEWDETAQVWQATTDAGEVLTARHLIFATGALAVPRLPDIPGIDRFGGQPGPRTVCPSPGFGSGSSEPAARVCRSRPPSPPRLGICRCSSVRRPIPCPPATTH